MKEKTANFSLFKMTAEQRLSDYEEFKNFCNHKDFPAFPGHRGLASEPV